MSRSRGLQPWRALAKSVALPLVGVLAGLSAAAAVTSAIEPTYRATASVIIRPAVKKSATDSTDLSQALNLAPSIARLAESREVADAVAAKLKVSADDVFERVTATSEPGSQIVTVQAEAGAAQLAAKVANEATKATAQLYRKLRLSGQTAVVVQPLDRAPAPGRPIAPRSELNYALGALAGFLIGIGFGSLGRRSDHRFRGVADIEAALGLPSVGVLPTVPRLFTGDAAQLYRRGPMADCVNSVMAAISVLGASRSGRRIIVTGVGGQREGTLLASVLAVALSSRGQSAILLDGQQRRPGLVRHFRRRPVQTVAEARGEPNMSQTTGLTVVGAAEMADHLHRSGEDVGPLLHELAELVDDVVLTAPPVLAGPELARVAEHADVVLLVVASDHASRAEAVRAALLLRRLEVAMVATIITGAAATEDGWHHAAWAGTSLAPVAARLSPIEAPSITPHAGGLPRPKPMATTLKPAPLAAPETNPKRAALPIDDPPATEPIPAPDESAQHRHVHTRAS